MKTKNKILIYPLIVMGLFLILNNSCKKDDNTVTGPVHVNVTSLVSDIKGSSASCGGTISSDGGSTITARGVCWGTVTTPTILNSTTSDGAGAGYFLSSITGLSPNTTYYVRAYATNANGTGYGSTMSFTTINLTAGDSYQGGIVGYIFVSGDPGYVSGQTHGLIIAPSNQSTGICWNNGSNTTIGTTSQAIGTGNANTNAIVANQGAGSYAARLCYDLSLGGYSDWYLPSSEELHKVYYRLGGSYAQYWTSSEYSSADAWWCDSSGMGYHFPKTDLLYVRAMRSF